MSKTTTINLNRKRSTWGGKGFKLTVTRRREHGREDVEINTGAIITLIAMS